MTRNYIPGPAPIGVSEWLVREFQAISEATFGAAPELQLIPNAREPAKPRTGMLVYADGTNWNPGSGAGVYVFTGTAWSKL
jgi:hypothetical protein